MDSTNKKDKKDTADRKNRKNETDKKDKKEWKPYKKILNRYSLELGKSAEVMEKKHSDVLFRTTVSVTAPILFAYVSWVLIDAAARGKEKLYFLARDGYVMLQIAKILCQKYQIPIECRYLYASRIAWRLPQYHLMGESCIEKIGLNGMNITLDKILERGALSEKEKEQIRIQLGLDPKEMERVLSKEEIEQYKEILVKQTKLLDYVYAHSKIAYRQTMGYLEQEGLWDGKAFAIVDIGWVGSMQESLTSLLESRRTDKKTGSPKTEDKKLEGYYFGMLGKTNKKSVYKTKEMDSCGIYHTWYFKARGQIKRKLYFSHNLFECMCCAADGMTIGYGYNKELEQYQPVFASRENRNIGKWDIKRQIGTIESYTKVAVTQIKDLKVWEKQTDTKKMVYQLCKQFMVHPTLEQAEYYGRFLFSDDVTENHMVELAPVMTEKQIRQNSVWKHIVNRLIPRRFSQIEKQSCWMEGTLVRSKCGGKCWKRLDYFLYKFLLFIVLNGL